MDIATRQSEPNIAPSSFSLSNPNSKVVPHRGRGLTLIAVGTIVLLAGQLIALGLAFGGLAAPAIGIGIASAWLGTKAIRKGKRYAKRSADEVMARDPRPPVVYLRSFAADGKTAEGVGHAVTLEGFQFGIESTEEEQIGKLMDKVGPFVAIGRPGEKVPELGASRMYVPDAEWHARVTTLIDKASMVLMRAGKSEGFWWEASVVVRHLAPERLVILVPYSPENYEVFRTRANEVFPKPLPEAKGDWSTQGSVKAVLWFAPDWTPHLDPVRASDVFAAQTAPITELLQRKLAPVFAQIGQSKLALRCAVVQRALALAIDYAVVTLAFFAGYLVGMLVSGRSDGLPSVLGLICVVAYFTVMDLPSRGGTVGKRICKLHICDTEGNSISTLRAVCRGLIKSAIVIIMPLAFLMGIVSLAWTVRKRMLQDVFTGTFVVENGQLRS